VDVDLPRRRRFSDLTDILAVGADGKNVREVTKPVSPGQVDVHAAWSTPSD